MQARKAEAELQEQAAVPKRDVPEVTSDVLGEHEDEDVIF